MPVVFPTTSVLDNANRANSGQPPSVSWVDVGSATGIRVFGNEFAIESGGVGRGTGQWQTVTADNCEVFGTVSVLPVDGGQYRLFIRANDYSASGNLTQGYLLRIERDDVGGDFIELSEQSTVTDIATETIVFSTGDKFGIRCHGDVISVWQDTGSGFVQIVSVTNSDSPSGGYIGQMVEDGPARADDFGGGDFVPVTSFFVVDDTFGLTESELWPILIADDDFPLDDDIALARVVDDDFPLDDDDLSIAALIVVDDDFPLDEFQEVSGTGIVIPDPDAPQTGGLDNKPVLRFLYGNDRRNPIKTLDISQTAPFHIALRGGGFAPGPGPEIELWSGQSIRLQGQKKIAESRDNSQLAITYDLSSTSATGLFHLQSEINRFFLDAKRYQTKFKQGHTVWLECRWADGLNTLPTPTFGQLSHYYEVLSAKLPKWPDSLHNVGVLETGNIEGVVINITGSPAPIGLRQRLGTAGGAISQDARGMLVASGSTSKLHWAGYSDSGLTGQFTVTGWMTLNATWTSGNKYIFDYYVSGSNRISIVYDRGNTRWTITKIVSGTTYTVNSDSDTIASGDDVHLILVQDGTTLHLYVNGVQVASVAAAATMTDGGLIALGCPGTGTLDGVDVILDGWRVLPDDITATQALAIYNAELPIKQLGKSVGVPPYLWTKDGDGQVDNCNESTTRNNWAIIGGVGGDLEAKTEIRLTGTASKYYWLGMWAQDEQVDPADYLWFESGTSISDSSASGGSYGSGVASPISVTLSQSPVAPTALFGQYKWLTRLKTLAGTLALTPGWFFSNSIPINNAVRAITNTAFKVLSFGDIFITTEATIVEDTIPIGLRIAGTGDTIYIDFAFLLPAPFAKITQPDHTSVATVTSTRPLVIEDGHAYVYLAAGSPTDQYEYAGGRIEAYPGKYNYLFVLRLNSDEEFSRTLTADLAVYVTPRYLVPGGMVA